MAAASLEQLLYQHGIDDHAAVDDARNRLGELIDVQKAVLEQVADPTLVAVEQPEGVLGLDVLGEDK